MDCKKVILIDAQSEWVYSNESGLVKNSIKCTIVDKDIGTFNLLQDVFVEDDNGYRNFTRTELESVFDIDLYVGSQNSINSIPGRQNNFRKINISELHISSLGKDVVATYDDPKAFYELLRTPVYELPNSYTYEKINADQVEEGMLVCNDNSHVPPGVYMPQRRKYSTYRIEKLFHQPNREGLLATAKNIVSGENVILRLSSAIYKVPYESYPDPQPMDELSIFDEEIEESKLQPFWEGDANDIKGNLYWQPMEDASQYIVSVYKYRSSYNGIKKLYLLEKFIVERNKCWLTIDNLIGRNYIIRLEAENRSGEIIGRTRGIPVKYPNKQPEVQYWKG